jgi:hypothetical protein
LGDGLSDLTAERFPGLRGITFTAMTKPALIVVGDNDHNPMFTDKADWRADPYHRSPGDNKTLLTMFDAQHMLGGVSGYDAGETTDENPTRVATLRALVWAYVRTALDPGNPAWPRSVSALATQANPMGRLDTRHARCENQS